MVTVCAPGSKPGPSARPTMLSVTEPSLQQFPCTISHLQTSCKCCINSCTLLLKENSPWGFGTDTFARSWNPSTQIDEPEAISAEQFGSKMGDLWGHRYARPHRHGTGLAICKFQFYLFDIFRNKNVFKNSSNWKLRSRHWELVSVSQTPWMYCLHTQKEWEGRKSLGSPSWLAS